MKFAQAESVICSLILCCLFTLILAILCFVILNKMLVPSNFATAHTCLPSNGLREGTHSQQFAN